MAEQQNYPLTEKQLSDTAARAWRKVKAETWTTDDWRDFHETLEGFKARLVERHTGWGPRRALLNALAQMPDEAFGWFVVWASGGMMQYPEGLGGFRPDSRESITALRAAAKAHLDTQTQSATASADPTETT